MALFKLIVGLGNPGQEYCDTRHNAGFWLLDQIATKYKATFTLENKFSAEVARFKYKDEDIILLKPQTYMNLSGKSVQLLASFYKIEPVQILVVHDELDFEPSIVKIKQGGGNGGHNGLKDIDRVIGKNYWRLRIGIGHPGDSSKVVGYVLKKPPTDELIEIFHGIDKTLSIFEILLDGKISEATKKLHTK